MVVTDDTADYDYGYEDPDPHTHSNKKRIWIAIGAIIVAIFILFLIWPSNDEATIVIPQDTVNVEETVVETPKDRNEIEVPEVKSETKQEPTKVESKEQPQVKKEVQEPKKEESKSENNSAVLKTALANGDYQQIQKLANQGYTPAYAPLAKYYLNNHDYKTAETYAKKAKAAGFSEGASILKTLENLGYYD